MQTHKQLTELIRDVPDYPTKGITFKDITPLLSDGEAYACVIARLADRYRDYDVDCILGMEARGFCFAAPLAVQLKTGFIPARKPGKLPREVISEHYTLEYDTSCLEIHKHDLPAGSRVLIVDDVLATGGTARAVTQLVKAQGADVVELAFLAELSYLKGKDLLDGFSIYSMLAF
ncbi:adenine phosphoribosyltransferase [Candidatus Sororendozoicomonas aggregata]|uniref:adenine phosphoribosyltransferase n=1 Tax=Candidatus Sororendozoicomonas aggregata TaxID=3073239 RepID=UPI002ED37E6D